MDDIRDIHINGIDPTRQPRVRKEPYIDLYFTLEPAAPPRWCEDFNGLAAGGDFPATIDPKKGLIIETWVRTPDEVVTALHTLKGVVRKTTEAYIARAKAESAALLQVDVPAEEQGEQGRLNKIIATLDFDADTP